MKITHTDIYRFSIPMEPFVIATGTMDFAQNVLIHVHTDSGLTGVGECSAFPMIVGETQETCLVMAKDFARLWEGKNPLELTSRLKELHDFTAFNSTVKSAFDMALYDLAAKNAGLPLYKFLGGRKRIIETDITIGIGSPEEMSRSAARYQETGAKILKIKLGKDPQTDLLRIAEIRRTVGPEMTLRVDANQGWSYEDALICLNGMKDFNIQFCEQPLKAGFDYQLPDLKKQVNTPIMADESCYSHHDAYRLLKYGFCDFINIKFSKSGGINEALLINKTAEEFGTECMIGSMLESRIALSANLHFAYACENVKYFDLDTCLLGHLEDPAIGGLTYDGYFLDIPDTPGIGADADPEYLHKCEKWTV